MQIGILNTHKDVQIDIFTNTDAQIELLTHTLVPIMNAC